MEFLPPYVVKPLANGTCPSRYQKCGGNKLVSPTTSQTIVMFGQTYIKETIGTLQKTTRTEYSVARNALDNGWEISAVVEMEATDGGLPSSKTTKNYPKDYDLNSGLDKDVISDAEVEKGIFSSSESDFSFGIVFFAHEGEDSRNHLAELNQSYGDEVDHVDRTFTILEQKTLPSIGSTNEALKNFTFFLEESRQSSTETRTYTYQIPVANDIFEAYMFHYVVAVNGVNYDTQDFQANKAGYEPIMLPYEGDISNFVLDNTQEAWLLAVRKSALKGKNPNDFVPNQDGVTHTWKEFNLFPDEKQIAIFAPTYIKDTQNPDQTATITASFVLTETSDQYIVNYQAESVWANWSPEGTGERASGTTTFSSNPSTLNWNFKYDSGVSLPVPTGTPSPYTFDKAEIDSLQMGGTLYSNESHGVLELGVYLLKDTPENIKKKLEEANKSNSAIYSTTMINLLAPSSGEGCCYSCCKIAKTWLEAFLKLKGITVSEFKT